MTSEAIFKQKAADFQQVLAYKILKNVKKNWHDVAGFKAAFSEVVAGRVSGDEQTQFCSALNMLKKDFRRILGKRHDSGKLRWITLDDIKPFLHSGLHHQRSFTKHYKSGKSFRVHSYWYIEWSKLEELLADERWLDCSCKEIYTKRQRGLIQKIIYKHDKKKEKESSEVSEKEQEPIENSKLEAKEEDMTKAEKEQYQKEYEEGKRMLTLDEALKEEAKKKRRADKHRATVAAKATEKVLRNYQELIVENDTLKKQHAELLKRNTSLEAEVTLLKEAKPQEASSSKVEELEAAIAGLKEDNEELCMLVEELQSKLEAAGLEKASPEDEEDEDAKLAEFESTVARLAPEINKNLADMKKLDANIALLENGNKLEKPSHPANDIPEADEDSQLNQMLLERLGILRLQSYVSNGQMHPDLLKKVVSQLGVEFTVRECPTKFAISRASQLIAKEVQKLLPKLIEKKQKLITEFYGQARKCA